MATDRIQVKDLDTLKALGHPLRIKLYRALWITGTATASQLADQVDEAVSLVSYHLRKLAAHGIIEEAEGHGDGRERWWQRASVGINTEDADFRDAPERAALHTAVSRMWSQDRVAMYENYLDAKAAWSNDWRDAAFSSGSMMPLTPEELSLMHSEILALVEEWRLRGEAARDAGDTEGRENVAVFAYGFPFRS